MFVNASLADLHLVASATNAIDKAPTLLTVTNDFDGDTRPRGASSDIGADEFVLLAPPVITDFRLAGAAVVISFLTVLGQSYDLQRAIDLTNGAWSLLASNIAGNGGVLRLTNLNALSQSRQFYRIRLSP